MEYLFYRRGNQLPPLAKDERGKGREITLAEARKLPGGPYSFTHILSNLDDDGTLDVALIAYLERRAAF